MALYVRLKTNRTKSGYANATLTRFFNYSDNRIGYNFQFYNTCKWFNHHEELRKYILDNYNVDIGSRKAFWCI